MVLSYFVSLLNFYDDTLGTGFKSPPEPLRRFRTSHFACKSVANPATRISGSSQDQMAEELTGGAVKRASQGWQFAEIAYFNFKLSADANLLRPSRICARDHAANPKVSAGSGSAFIKHDDNGDGLIPISVHTRVINGMWSFCRTQATKCSPASGISRKKYLPNKLLNCSIKNCRRSEYNFRIRFM